MEKIKQFKFGHLYFLVGPGGAATYIIKQVALYKKIPLENIKTIDIVNLSELSEYESSPFSQSILVANLNSQYKLNLSNFYKPDTNSIVFIQLSFFWKDHSKVKDSVEPLTSEYIELVDLKKYNWLRQKEFKEWYNSLEQEQQSLVQQYKDNPIFLEDLKNNNRVKDIYSPSNTFSMGFDLLELLGDKDAIKVVNNLPLSECYKFWFNRNFANTPAYKFLAGGPASHTTNPLLKSHLGDWTEFIHSLRFDNRNNLLVLVNGKCSLVWYYYDHLVNKKLSKNKDYNIKDLLILFVHWLVLCNNIKDTWKTGITRKVNRAGNSYYIFKPHSKATNLID